MANRGHLLSRAVKLFVSAGFFAGTVVQRALLRAIGKPPAPSRIILYYHSVVREDQNAFARQMDMLVKFTTPVDEERLPKLLPGKYYSAITFDDGFEDALENAVPELVRRGIHATLFLTVGAMGKPADWWPASAQESGRRIATADQIRSMPREWIRVGAHTMTHPRLSGLQEPDAKYEILEPRYRLESLLGYKIRSLSFPYGDFDNNVVRWCREAGYERIYTTEHKRAFENSRSCLIGRVKVEPTDWGVEFLLKLLGGYVWLPTASYLKRRLLSAVTHGKSCFYSAITMDKPEAGS